MKITAKHTINSPVTFVRHKRFAVLLFLPSCCVNSLLGWFSNRAGTSFDDGKEREKDLTLLPVPSLPLSHWSSQLFDLRAPSSTDVPVLLLNQPINNHRAREELQLMLIKALHGDVSLYRVRARQQVKRLTSIRSETFSLRICLAATKFVFLNVFSIIETICLVKITNQVCKKSTSGWRASLKNVDA